MFGVVIQWMTVAFDFILFCQQEFDWSTTLYYFFLFFLFVWCAENRERPIHAASNLSILPRFFLASLHS
jgi:hypothetical protein